MHLRGRNTEDDGRPAGDTLLNRVCVYDYDRITGAIGGERSFFEGFPDGCAMDGEGYLWNCRYGGGCIVRVAPDGEIDRVIEMPTANITSCTFGGPNYRTLYATSASADARPGDRLAGGVFAIQTAVAGQAENRFRME
jgi:sugar lactone lactonase YvrE